MTPRRQPSPPNDKAASLHSASDEDEKRPTHTSEIGTLKKLPNQGTAWLGSSSGVYFVNTVRRAFSAAFAASQQSLPASEDILTGEDAEGRSYNGPTLSGPSTTDQLPQLFSTSLGTLPERKIAMELVTGFFEAWHPVFPFLHGPSFLKDMEILYQLPRPTPPTFSKGNTRRRSSSQAATPDVPPPDVRKLITFQLVINIATLDRTEISLPAPSRINSPADVTRVAGSLALDHSLATIQTLLAAQLYLVATLAIRAASTVGGIIVKLIYHAGLHRCPLRYAQLSLEDCEIRKRIFWSAYALDRHCSLSLGDPNTIQDDDIDVCLSGRELHKAVARDLLRHPEHEINLHMPRTHQRVGSLTSGPVSDDPRATQEPTPEVKEKSLREAALISYVRWSRLTGRIIEIFHKSINHRFPKQDAIMYLTSDIETWWNDLPSLLTGDDTPTDSATHLQCLASFFRILYHRLHLLISRPRLSLDQSTPEFQHGLQICIRASRNILAGLKAHQKLGQSMFLPGLLSAAWMSGLIIAFACQLGKYPKARACADIHACLSLLSSMNTRWYTVGNCHKVLSLLLSNIQSRKASTDGLLAVPKLDQPFPSSHPDKDTNGARPHKRQRTKSSMDKFIDANGTKEKGNLSPKTMTEGTNSNQSSPNFTVPPPQLSETAKPKDTPSSVWSTSSLDKTYDLSSFMNLPPPSNSNTFANPNPSGSALYANPQEMAFAQSNMGLPELPNSNGMNGGIDDPVFWANMDFNMADVFGSAAWETMTGPFAPGWDVGGGGTTTMEGGGFIHSNNKTALADNTSYARQAAKGSNTAQSDSSVFDSNSDKLMHQLLGAGRLAMSDREAALDSEERGSQGSTSRDDSLDYMKIR